MADEDRRKLKRRHLLYYLRVYNADTGRLLGHLVDISPGGVMVMSQNRRRLGRRVTLRMVLPNQPRRAKIIEFDATTRWCSRDVNPDFWDTGFETTRLGRRQLIAIETLIEDYGFRD
jgi:hypothetical protein